jgi:general L-amino acid transport system substrate-binding protein
MTGRRLAAAIGAVVLGLGAAALPARAADMLARVHAEGTVRCGAAERPGFAAADEAGRITGLAVDLCRAVAVAVLGPAGHVDFQLYDSDRSFDAVRHGDDELFFLDGADIAEQRLVPFVLPGPAVFYEPIALLVPEAARVQRPQDLAGATICLMIGSAAQRALEATFTRLAIPFAPFAFREDVEMLDAFNVGKCQAMVGDATYLADLSRDRGVNHLASRMLSPPLSLRPIVAATGTGDGRWSALIAWVLDAEMLADAPASAWRPDPPDLPAPALGLRPDWRAEVAASVGSYGAMLRRHLGADSPLHLAPGANALWPDGLLAPPLVP